MNTFKIYFAGLLLTLSSTSFTVTEVDKAQEQVANQPFTLTVKLSTGEAQVIVQGPQQSKVIFGESAVLALTVADETYVLYNDGTFQPWGEAALDGHHYDDMIQVAALILYLQAQHQQSQQYSSSPAL